MIDGRLPESTTSSAPPSVSPLMSAAADPDDPLVRRRGIGQGRAGHEVHVRGGTGEKPADAISRRRGDDGPRERHGRHRGVRQSDERVEGEEGPRDRRAQQLGERGRPPHPGECASQRRYRDGGDQQQTDRRRYEQRDRDDEDPGDAVEPRSPAQRAPPSQQPAREKPAQKPRGQDHPPCLGEQRLEQTGDGQSDHGRQHEVVESRHDTDRAIAKRRRRIDELLVELEWLVRGRRTARALSIRPAGEVAQSGDRCDAGNRRRSISTGGCPGIGCRGDLPGAVATSLGAASERCQPDRSCGRGDAIPTRRPGGAHSLRAARLPGRLDVGLVETLPAGPTPPLRTTACQSGPFASQWPAAKSPRRR